jgi:hypothetical protein
MDFVQDRFQWRALLFPGLNLRFLPPECASELDI